MSGMPVSKGPCKATRKVRQDFSKWVDEAFKEQVGDKNLTPAERLRRRRAAKRAKQKKLLAEGGGRGGIADEPETPPSPSDKQARSAFSRNRLKSAIFQVAKAGTMKKLIAFAGEERRKSQLGAIGEDTASGGGGGSSPPGHNNRKKHSKTRKRGRAGKELKPATSAPPVLFPTLERPAVSSHLGLETHGMLGSVSGAGSGDEQTSLTLFGGGGGGGTGPMNSGASTSMSTVFPSASCSSLPRAHHPAQRLLPPRKPPALGHMMRHLNQADGLLPQLPQILQQNQEDEKEELQSGGGFGVFAEISVSSVGSSMSQCLPVLARADRWGIAGGGTGAGSAMSDVPEGDDSLDETLERSESEAFGAVILPDGSTAVTAAGRKHQDDDRRRKREKKKGDGSQQRRKEDEKQRSGPLKSKPAAASSPLTGSSSNSSSSSLSKSPTKQSPWHAGQKLGSNDPRQQAAGQGSSQAMGNRQGGTQGRRNQQSSGQDSQPSSSSFEADPETASWRERRARGKEVLDRLAPKHASYLPASASTFEHVPGCQVCLGLYPHYTSPDGKTVHHMFWDAAAPPLSTAVVGGSSNLAGEAVAPPEVPRLEQQKPPTSMEEILNGKFPPPPEPPGPSDWMGPGSNLDAEARRRAAKVLDPVPAAILPPGKASLKKLLGSDGGGRAGSSKLNLTDIEADDFPRPQLQLLTDDPDEASPELGRLNVLMQMVAGGELSNEELVEVLAEAKELSVDLFDVREAMGLGVGAPSGIAATPPGSNTDAKPQKVVRAQRDMLQQLGEGRDLGKEEMQSLLQQSFQVGLSPLDVERAAGGRVTPGDLKEAGFSMNQVEVIDLLRQLHTNEEAIKALKGELSEASVKAHEKQKTLLLRQACLSGIPAATISNYCECSSEDLRKAGYANTSVKKVNKVDAIAALRSAGFTASHLRQACFTAWELKQGGYHGYDTALTDAEVANQTLFGFRTTEQISNAEASARKMSMVVVPKVAPRQQKGKVFRTSKRIIHRAFVSDLQQICNHQGISKLVKDETDVAETRAFLEEKYEAIVRVYRFYALLGTRDVFSIQDNAFQDFGRDCQLFELEGGQAKVKASDPDEQRLMLQSELNMVFVATTFQGSGEVRRRQSRLNNAKSLVRFEFVEALLRIGIGLYHRTGSCGGKCEFVHEAMKKLWTNHIVGRARLVEGQSFRDRGLYQPDIAEFLRFHYGVIETVFRYFARQTKSTDSRAEIVIDFKTWMNMVNHIFKEADDINGTGGGGGGGAAAGSSSSEDHHHDHHHARDHGSAGGGGGGEDGEGAELNPAEVLEDVSDRQISLSFISSFMIYRDEMATGQNETMDFMDFYEGVVRLASWAVKARRRLNLAEFGDADGDEGDAEEEEEEEEEEEHEESEGAEGKSAHQDGGGVSGGGDDDEDEEEDDDDDDGDVLGSIGVFAEQSKPAPQASSQRGGKGRSRRRGRSKAAAALLSAGQDNDAYGRLSESDKEGKTGPELEEVWLHTEMHADGEFQLYQKLEEIVHMLRNHVLRRVSPLKRINVLSSQRHLSIGGGK